MAEHTPRKNLLELTSLFLRLGFTAFGGPAAHIGMYHHEVVVRRKWLSEQQFLDLLGMVNLIPGPNSTEMVIAIGLRQGGVPGLVLSGVAFILPAMLIVTGMAWVYVAYGSLPQTGWLMYGIKPVMIAIILQALWMLGRKAVRDWLTAAAAITGLILLLAGVSPLWALALGGLLVFSSHIWHRRKAAGLHGALWFAPGLAGSTLAAAIPFSLNTLFLTFLKIGAVLYGSGYVLLAFLRADFVERLGWLTDQQLLDAIAVGQITPGPVFTTATFIGYLLGGLPGALLGTLGIFLPSFFFVLLVHRQLEHLRKSATTAALLDGFNAASLGLMAAVTLQLGQSSLVDIWTFVIAALSLLGLTRFKVNATWLVLAGGLIGLVRYWFS